MKGQVRTVSLLVILIALQIQIVITHETHKRKYHRSQTKAKPHHSSKGSKHVRLKKRFQRKKQGSGNPIRIKLLYMQSIEKSIHKDYFKKDFMPTIVKFFQGLFMLNKQTVTDLSNYKPDPNRRKLCSSIQMTDKIKNKHKADFVLVVDVDEKTKSYYETEYSICAEDPKDNNRPIMAVIRFYTKIFEAKEERSHKNTMNVVHDVMHCLGFGGPAINQMKKKYGDGIIKKVKRRGFEPLVLDVPRLTEYGKVFFECDSFDGVEIEKVNYGISDQDDAYGGHFAARLIREDVMVSHRGYYKQFTEFSAIYMEESGWYTINRRQMGVCVSGKKQGCGYITDECASKKTDKDANGRTVLNVQNQLDFCTTLGDYSECEYCKDQQIRWKCNSIFSGYGSCGIKDGAVIKRKSDLSTMFNYDGQNTLMLGYYRSIDNCPVIMEWRDKQCTSFFEGKDKDVAENYHGKDSMCIAGNFQFVKKKDVKEYEDRQYCLKIKCTKESDLSVVTIHVNEFTQMTCKKGDEKKKLELQGKIKNAKKEVFDSGYIYCPEDIDRFCVSSEMEYFATDYTIPYEKKEERVFTSTEEQEKEKDDFKKKVKEMINKNGGMIDRSDLYKKLYDQLNGYPVAEFSGLLDQSNGSPDQSISIIDAAVAKAGNYASKDELEVALATILFKLVNKKKGLDNDANMIAKTVIQGLSRKKDDGNDVLVATDKNEVTNEPVDVQDEVQQEQVDDNKDQEDDKKQEEENKKNEEPNKKDGDISLIGELTKVADKNNDPTKQQDDPQDKKQESEQEQESNLPEPTPESKPQGNPENVKKKDNEDNQTEDQPNIGGKDQMNVKQKDLNPKEDPVVVTPEEKPEQNPSEEQTQQDDINKKGDKENGQLKYDIVYYVGKVQSLSERAKEVLREKVDEIVNSKEGQNASPEELADMMYKKTEWITDLMTDTPKAKVIQAYKECFQNEQNRRRLSIQKAKKNIKHKLKASKKLQKQKKLLKKNVGKVNKQNRVNKKLKRLRQKNHKRKK